MGAKQDVISALFKECKENNNFIFDNDRVKDLCRKLGFGNPFDVTKVDNSSLLPDDVKKNDYFIIHLGSGRHQFVKELIMVIINLKRFFNQKNVIGNIAKVY